MTIRREKMNSRKTAILAIFSSIVIALEVFPVPGVTDLPFYPFGIPFTIDWTGIPLVVIFLLLGLAPSLFGTFIVLIAIGYRNPIGAVFKFTAEFLTILGVYVAHYLLRDRSGNRLVKLGVYLAVGALFRGLGMFIANLFLLPLFYPLYYPSFDLILFASYVLIPWNVLQAIINIVGGFIVYEAIPISLKDQIMSEGEQLELP